MAQKLEIKLSNVRALAAREFTGHGSTFNNRDLGGDIVVKGAFRASLERHRQAGTWPKMFWAHQPDKVPGKWLDIREDDTGLAVHGVLADTPLGNEVHTLLKMEAVAGLSIGFQTVRSDFDGNGNRRLIELELHEVSVVSQPMNQAAQVSAIKRHDFANAIANIRDYEVFCRSAYNLSRGAAKRLASKTWVPFAEAIGADPTESELSNLTDELEAATCVAVLRTAASRIRSL